MREILFRARTISEDEYMDSGEWVEGFYTCFNGDEYRIYTGYSETDCGAHYPDWFNVLPATVGQFTGLTDKNGKKSFEGDIVQYYGTYPLEVYIEKGHTKIRWYDTISASKYDELFFSSDREGYGECEIIGNIHDNPELLKGGEE